MRLAPEGVPTIAIALGLAALSFAGWAVVRQAAVLYLALGFLIVSLFLAFFFRDPRRDGSFAADQVVAPADGRVIAVREVDEPHFLKGRAWQVSIFLSVFDVHVNRVPAAGRVEYKQYYPGKFLPAFQDKASTDNEQMHLGIENPKGKILMKQIAGLLARRVVCYPNIGDEVKPGQRLGLIKFGSRVDLLLPAAAKPAVQSGTSVTGGKTVIATW